jgi:multicomponent Na+:H+ antiporter subunit C
MSVLLHLLCGVLVAAAVYLMLARDLYRVLLGMMLLASGVNLALFSAGRVVSRKPPLLLPGGGLDVPPEALANPLPQAFVLTAIVISLALFAFVIALLWPVEHKLGTLDVEQMRHARLPPPGKAKK